MSNILLGTWSVEVVRYPAVALEFTFDRGTEAQLRDVVQIDEAPAVIKALILRGRLAEARQISGAWITALAIEAGVPGVEFRREDANRQIAADALASKKAG